MEDKELEEWIGQNMPESDCHPVFIGGWVQGARAMAEHLQEKQREENDAAFYLGVDAGKQQTPTRETLEKFLRIAQTWTGGKLNPIIVDYILEHWKDE